MRKSIFIVAAIFMLVVLFVNQFVDKPRFDNPKDKLEFVLKEKQRARLDLIYLELLSEDSLNMDYHYGFLTNYFLIPKNYRTIDQKRIEEIYWNYTSHEEAFINDIGFYALGLMASINGDYNHALIDFSLVNNENLKYLNNSIGKVHAEMKNYEEAEKYFLKAIEIKGNLEGAYSNLIELYYSQSRLDDLYNLLKNRNSRKYFPSQLKRFLFLSKFNLLGYFESVFSHTYQNQSLTGFLGALLIMLSWLFF